LSEKKYNDARIEEIEALFSTEGNCERTIVRAIDSAEKDIDIAVYKFTNEEIV